MAGFTRRSSSLWSLVLALLPSGYGNDWPAPVIREVFSPARSARSFSVRVVPEEHRWHGGTQGFCQGSYATTEFYRREQDKSCPWRIGKSLPAVYNVAPG